MLNKKEKSLVKEYAKKLVAKRTLTEAPAKNLPKVQKLVDEINALIAKDVDENGVVDKSGSWQTSYTYEPIIYRNGALKIISSEYASHTKDVDVVKSKDMELDGIPQLLTIRRLYKAMLKKEYNS